MSLITSDRDESHRETTLEELHSNENDVSSRAPRTEVASSKPGERQLKVQLTITR